MGWGCPSFRCKFWTRLKDGWISTSYVLQSACISRFEPGFCGHRGLTDLCWAPVILVVWRWSIHETYTFSISIGRTRADSLQHTTNDEAPFVPQKRCVFLNFYVSASKISGPNNNRDANHRIFSKGSSMKEKDSAIREKSRQVKFGHETARVQPANPFACCRI